MISTGLKSSRELLETPPSIQITNEMIECFEGCTRSGNYDQFRNKYDLFIYRVNDSLKYLFIDHGHQLNYLLRNFKRCFDFIYKSHSDTGFYDADDVTMEILNNMRSSIATKDWSKFYVEYRHRADFIIREGRKNNTFNFSIQYNNQFYQDFAARERAISIARGDPLKSKNSGEMILYGGTKTKFAEDARSKNENKTALAAHNSSNGRSFTATRQSVDHSALSTDSLTRVREISGCDSRTLSSLPPIPYRTSSIIGSSWSSRNPGYPNNTGVSSAAVSRPSNLSSPSHANFPSRAAAQPTGSVGRSYLDGWSHVTDESSSKIAPQEIHDNESVKFQNDATPSEKKTGHRWEKQNPNMGVTIIQIGSTPPEPQSFSVRPEFPDQPKILEHSHSFVGADVQSSDNCSSTTRSSDVHMGNIKSSATDCAEEKQPNSSFIRGSRSLQSFARKQLAVVKPNTVINTKIDEDVAEELRIYELEMNTSKRKAVSILGSAGEVQSELNESIDYAKRRAEEKFGETLYSPVSEEPDDSFEQELRKQNEEFETKQKRLRDERAKRQKEHEEHLAKVKEESRKRFQLLLACIKQKHKFEEQQKQWSEWIEGVRSNIRRCQSNFYDFEDSHSRMRNLDDQDIFFFNQDVNSVCVTAVSTFDLLHDDFEQLKRVEEHCPDALFARVLQKCIATVATKLLRLMSLLDDLHADQSLMSSIDDLNSNDVYSTTKLRLICKDARSEDYQNVEFPKIASSTVIEELSEV